MDGLGFLSLDNQSNNQQKYFQYDCWGVNTKKTFHQMRVSSLNDGQKKYLKLRIDQEAILTG